MRRSYRVPEKAVKPSPRMVKIFQDALKKPLKPNEVRITSLPHYWQLQILGMVHYTRKTPICPWDGRDLKEGYCSKCERKYI